jgi:hypothetical protein
MGNLRIAGKKPSFRGMLPECNGGTLELTAPGYQKASIRVNTVVSDKSHGMGNLEVVSMIPQKDMNYEVRIATDVNNPSLYRGLLPDEVAMVTVSSIGEDNFEHTVYYPTNISNYQTIPLVKSHELFMHTFDVKIFKSNSNANNLMDAIKGGRISGAAYLENISFSYTDVDNSDKLIIYAVSKSSGFTDTKSFYDYYETTIYPNMDKFKPVLQ